MMTTRPEPYLLVAVALVGGDQLTKLLFGQLAEPVTLAGLSFGRVVNQAGVFGLSLDNELLVAGGLLICLGLGWLLATRQLSPPARLGLWLLLAGAFSNLIDRILVGGVVDIMAIGSLPRFNLADVTILLGAVSLLRGLWWRPRPEYG